MKTARYIYHPLWLLILKESGMNTYSGQSIDPWRNIFSCQPIANIIGKMIAILDNEMISVPIVLVRTVFNKGSKFLRCHIGSTNFNATSKSKSRTILWLHLENSTRGLLMSSKCIFRFMSCTPNTTSLVQLRYKNGHNLPTARHFTNSTRTRKFQQTLHSANLLREWVKNVEQFR